MSVERSACGEGVEENPPRLLSNWRIFFTRRYYEGRRPLLASGSVSLGDRILDDAADPITAQDSFRVSGSACRDSRGGGARQRRDICLQFHPAAIPEIRFRCEDCCDYLLNGEERCDRRRSIESPRRGGCSDCGPRTQVRRFPARSVTKCRPDLSGGECPLMRSWFSRTSARLHRDGRAAGRSPS
jgi:hypothetical protein